MNLAYNMQLIIYMKDHKNNMKDHKYSILKSSWRSLSEVYKISDQNKSKNVRFYYGKFSNETDKSNQVKSNQLY